MGEIHLRFSFSRKAFLIPFGIILASVLLALGIIFYLRQYTGSLGLPREKISGITFPVYAPKHPPKGFSLQTNNISASSEALAYGYTYNGNKTLAITVQPRPDNLDPTTFNPTDSYPLAIGKDISEVYLVDLETRTTAAIITSKSLVFINTPDRIDLNQLRTFIATLVRIN